MRASRPAGGLTICITGLVYHFVLATDKDPLSLLTSPVNQPANTGTFLLHYAVPLMVLLDFPFLDVTKHGYLGVTLNVVEYAIVFYLLGLAYTSAVTFPRTKVYVSRLVTALGDAATGHETARPGGVLWLRSPG